MRDKEVINSISVKIQKIGGILVDGVYNIVAYRKSEGSAANSTVIYFNRLYFIKISKIFNCEIIKLRFVALDDAKTKCFDRKNEKNAYEIRIFCVLVLHFLLTNCERCIKINTSMILFAQASGSKLSFFRREGERT